MSKSIKITILVASTVVGFLSGASIVWPANVVLFSTISASIASIVAIITGISLKKDS